MVREDHGQRQAHVAAVPLAFPPMAWPLGVQRLEVLRAAYTLLHLHVGLALGALAILTWQRAEARP